MARLADGAVARLADSAADSAADGAADSAADGAVVMISAEAAAIPAMVVTTDERHPVCTRFRPVNFIRTLASLPVKIRLDSTATERPEHGNLAEWVAEAGQT